MADEKKAKEDPIEQMVGCVVIFAMLPSGIIVRAWVMATLWRWFVPLAFPTAPHLSTPLVIGLMELVSVARHVTYPETKADERALKTAGKSFFMGIAFPLLCLFVGWLALRFV
jgi:hypothetical protein